jgi:hypothetical protein
VKLRYVALWCGRIAAITLNRERSHEQDQGGLSGASAVGAAADPGALHLAEGAIAQNTVKVGILHSRPVPSCREIVVDAEMLAIREINKSGGVMGEDEPVVEDGAMTGRPSRRPS